MKKIALFLTLILLMGILPIQAQMGNYYEIDNGSKIRLYKDTAGYDQLLKPDGSVLVYSQRYTVEYMDGKNWKQIMIPFNVIQDGDTISRQYKDYVGTTGEVVYRKTEGGIKSDFIINSAETREYRIVWGLDGIVNEDVRYGVNFVEFYNGDEWIRFDWNDAYTEFGDITSYQISESANGKKLDVTFNIGTVKAGETLTLDPVIVDGYGVPQQNTFAALGGKYGNTTAVYSSIGQAFYNNVSGNYLDSAKFNLLRINNPTANLYAVLYSYTGTLGVNATATGPALATSDPVNSSTVSSIAYELTSFNFTGSERHSLAVNTTYIIAIQSTGSGILNNVNPIRVGIDNAGSHPGNTAYYHTGSWGYNAGWDTIFYVYSGEYFNWIDEVYDFINSAFQQFGVTGFMTQITTLITGISTYFESSLTSVLTLITNQFTIITNIFPWFIRWLTRFVSLFVDLGGILVSILNGTHDIMTGITSFWDTIGFNASTYTVIPVFAFIWWWDSVERRGKTQGDLQVMLGDAQTLMNIISYFSSMFFTVVNTVIDLTFRLFEAIT